MSYTPAWISSLFRALAASTRRPTRRDVPPCLRRRARRGAPIGPLRAPRGSPRAGRRPRGQYRALLRILRARDRRRRHRCRRRCVSQRAPRPRPSLSLPLPPNRPRLVVRAPPGTPTASPARRPPRARRGFSRAHPPPFRPIQPSRERRTKGLRPPLPRAVRHPRAFLDPRDTIPKKIPFPIARSRPPPPPPPLSDVPLAAFSVPPCFPADDKDRLKALVALGASLPLPDDAKSLTNRVMGCASSTWIDVALDAPTGAVSVRGASDAQITAGFLGLLARGLDGMTPRRCSTSPTTSSSPSRWVRRRFRSRAPTVSATRSRR